jgi:hypothetical protein
VAWGGETRRPTRLGKGKVALLPRVVVLEILEFRKCLGFWAKVDV